MLFTNLAQSGSAFLSTKEWKFVDVCFPALYFDYIHLIRIVIGLFICLCLLWLSELLVLQSTGDNKLKTTFTWSTTTIKKKKTFRGYRYLFRPTKYGEREQARGEPRV